MSSDHPSQEGRPAISHPLARNRSRGPSIPEANYLASHPPRPTSPPPRPARGKAGIFSLMRRSGGTLESMNSAGEEEDGPSPAAHNGKGKGKGKDRWSKRASRKAPPPPPPRERGPSEELDWERIKTLPRVRLVPPEDEGEPVMLYPIPHPSSLLPLRPRPQSPPTLLSATVAATLITTDPTTPINSPPPTPPTSPPRGVVPNSLAHATFMSQQHGHWIGMSDKFILPPPIFSRGPTASGRPAATRGIIMPKTRRQVEADIGKRMSMVDQRKRDSLELERINLLPPLEEAAQSPPNIMMPPVMEGDDQSDIDEADEDLPLAVVRNRARPASPPPRPRFEPAMETQPFALRLSSPPRIAPKPIAPVLGPAIELVELPSRTTSRDTSPSQTTSPPPPLVVHYQQPPAPLGLPTPPPPPPQLPLAHPKPPTTRTKRSKSLTAVLSRSMSDDGPSTAAPPPVPPLKRQKSLKKLFFPNSDAPPPLPSASPGPRGTQRWSVDVKADPPASASKKGRMSRAKSKPSLRIEVKPQPPGRLDGGAPTPALGTASSSVYSEAYPLTPAASGPSRQRQEELERTKTPHSSGGIRGLSKRFSLSNMSGAFRKKASISGMIPMPSEAEVPLVPELPAVYRKSVPPVKNKGKGKEREIVDPDPPTRIAAPTPAYQSLISPLEGDDNAGIDDGAEPEFDESFDSPEAGPSGLSTEIGHAGTITNLIGLTSLGTEPFDILDSDFEFPPTSADELPASADANASPASKEESDTEPFAADPYPDADTCSLSSCSSLDDYEQPSIVRAQLLHVSPTTRRNPGVSLQEFLGTAPLPQTGVFVATPPMRRRSVEGVIMGPLLLPETPRPTTHSVAVAVEATVKEKKKEAKPKSDRPPSGSPLVIDLRGQYLRRIGPSGSRGTQQLLERSVNLGSPTSPASPASVVTVLAPPAQIDSPPAPVPLTPVVITAPPAPAPEPVHGAPVEDTDDEQSEASTDQEREEVPATPLSEGGNILEEPVIHVENHPGDASQSSIDSLVIVETPVPPSPPLAPANNSARNASSRSSTPRSRFTTPDALLRLLTSPLGSSRLSRLNATPSSNGSSKGRKSLAPSAVPLPAELDGLPIPRQEDGDMNWSTLLAGSQLGSLHFDDLGLDLSFGEAMEGVSV